MYPFVYQFNLTENRLVSEIHWPYILEDIFHINQITVWQARAEMAVEMAINKDYHND